MRIVIIGNIEGNPDEGMKNITNTLYDIFSKNHSVYRTSIRHILQPIKFCALKRFRPDIIHYIHGPSFKSILLLKVIKVLLLNSVKTVMSATRPVYRGYPKYILKYFLPDIILSQAIQYEEFLQKNGSKTVFIPNGVNCEKFNTSGSSNKISLRKKYNISSEKYIILHVGHIKTNRNLGIFLELQKLDKVQVVIIGSSDQKVNLSLKGELIKSGITVISKYIGEINELYNLADVFIFPVLNRIQGNINEVDRGGAIDIPLSVLEAMACNLPIITTQYGALKRLFVEVEYFRYCDDPDEILDLVREFMIKKWAVNTREMVLKYDWIKVASMIEKEYEKLLYINHFR